MIFYFFVKNNYTGLLGLIVLSLTGNLFYFDFFGSRIIIFQLISLLFIPILLSKSGKKMPSLINGIKFEYILLIALGVLYGLLIPWVDYSGIRSWNQQASGRSLVALTRILSELSLVYFTYFIFISKRVNLKKFLNILSTIILITSLVAFFDLFFNYPIFRILFGIDNLPEIIQSRLLGFSHEPRSLGRLLTVGWMFLFLYRINGYKFVFRNVSLILGFVAIVFSFSFSTYFIFLLGIIIIFKNYFFKKTFSLIVIVVMLLIASTFLKKIESFSEGFMLRYTMVLEGKEYFSMPGEPLFFTRFEIFDRAALNFFYNNPKHLIFGTGPNLISIPASEYLGKSGAITFEGTINSIPSFGIINLVSRSGLLGLFLYLGVFIKIYKTLNKKDTRLLRDLLTVIFIMYLFVKTPWLYFTIGFIISQRELLTLPTKQ